MKCSKQKFERLMALNCYNNEKLAAAMGVNVMTVSKLRNGKTTPRAQTMEKLCEVFKCTPADILED